MKSREEFFELTCQGVSAGYEPEKPVLKGVDLRLSAGEKVAVIGPNASGKSTLLRVMAGERPPLAGAVLLNGTDLKRISPKARARILSRVPQRPRISAPFTIREFVGMGRYPHQGFNRRESVRDREAVARALNLTGLAMQAEQPLTSLSGGEQQRAVLAQALAQETAFLLLDEPNAFLDLRHQFSLLDTLQSLHEERRLTIVLVVHDLNLAVAFADRIVLMDKGRIVRDGKPFEALTAEVIQEVYGVKASRIDQGTGRPYFILWPFYDKKRTAGPGGKRLHLIGGGGSGGNLMQKLVENGYDLTLGVVGRGDTDLQLAEYYGVPAATVPAFSEIPEEALEKASEWVRASDGVILANLYFGRGNIGNLRLAKEGLAAGKPLWLVDETPIAERDFTGGEAQRLYKELIDAGARVVPHAAYLLEYIKERPDPADY